MLLLLLKQLLMQLSSAQTEMGLKNGAKSLAIH